MLTQTDAAITQNNYHSTRVALTDNQAALLFAVLEEPFPDTHPRCLRELIRAYIRRVEVEGATQQFPMLSRNFNKRELLHWAASIGWPMKSDYKERLAILEGATVSEPDNGNVSPGTDTGEASPKVDTAKAGGLNIAGIISAGTWAEIEIQMGGQGIRARKSGTEKWHPAGGAIPKEGGTDYNSAVHDLNTKMRDAFGLGGQAFKTEGAITKSIFAGISVKR